MVTSKKSKKFDPSLSLQEKLDQVLMGLDYKFGAMLQDRISEVFNSNKKQFKSFIEYLDSPEGEKHLHSSEFTSAHLLIDLFGRCKGQFENDWDNGSYESLEETADYVFDSGYELYDWEWNKFNDLK
jgi:hypothetical protein